MMEEVSILIAKSWIADAIKLVFGDLNCSFKDGFSYECLPYCEIIIIGQAKERCFFVVHSNLCFISFVVCHLVWSSWIKSVW